jgi:hypothetical protein
MFPVCSEKTGRFQIEEIHRGFVWIARKAYKMALKSKNNKIVPQKNRKKDAHSSDICVQATMRVNKP